MKIWSAGFAVALALLVPGCVQPPGQANGTGVAYRHHFAGTAQIARGTNAIKLKEILALPATRELRDEILAKLAKAPQEFWRNQLPAGAADQSALIRPLLEDLWSAESLVEVRGPNNRLETVIAIQLEDERARLWDANLRKLVVALKLGPPENARIEGIDGWEAKLGDATRLQVARSGRWTLLSLGPPQATPLRSLVQSSAKGQPVPALPKDALLELEADLPRLGKWFPVFAHNALPPTRWTVYGRGESLRTEATFRYAAALPIKFEPWRIPTNFVNEPLISFTVGQGIAPLLSQIKGVSSLGWKSSPNQFCLWSLADAPWQTYAAFPVDNATNTINAIAPKLPPVVFGLLGETVGDIAWITNKAEVRWTGLPFVFPFLRAASGAGGDYMLMGLVPLPPRTNPPPAELYAQLKGRNDLVYYDWELTEKRIDRAVPLDQVFHVIKRWQSPGTNAPTRNWLHSIQPKLGNTITEVTRTSPTELSLVRRSNLGLTAFELVTLMHWVESSGFPLRNDPPPSWPRLGNRRPPAGATNRPANPRTSAPAATLPPNRPAPARTNAPAAQAR